MNSIVRLLFLSFFYSFVLQAASAKISYQSIPFATTALVRFSCDASCKSPVVDVVISYRHPRWSWLCCCGKIQRYHLVLSASSSTVEYERALVSSMAVLFSSKGGSKQIKYDAQDLADLRTLIMHQEDDGAVGFTSNGEL